MSLDYQYSGATTPFEFFDTHCHIQEIGAFDGDNTVHNKWIESNINNPQEVIDRASEASVTRVICVGTTLEDSVLAADFVADRPNCWASIGIHPHEATPSLQALTLHNFAMLAEKSKVVAVGECGLDYLYNHSVSADQKKVLRFQLDLAVRHDLPLIFHVREAFSDFWPIFDEYQSAGQRIRGVMHSFSSGMGDLEQILARGLYVGLNGIMTFTKNSEQLLAAKAIPLSNLLLETDAPYLTPAPHRGTICEPKHVSVTAEFLAGLRDEDLALLAQATTQNACNLFGTV